MCKYSSIDSVVSNILFTIARQPFSVREIYFDPRFKRTVPERKTSSYFQINKVSYYVACHITLYLRNSLSSETFLVSSYKPVKCLSRNKTSFPQMCFLEKTSSHNFFNLLFSNPSKYKIFPLKTNFNLICSKTLKFVFDLLSLHTKTYPGNQWSS